MADKVKKASPHQFMVGDSTVSCDWRWPEGHPVWLMSSKDGVGWNVDGPLTEEGRTLILKKFGLDTVADRFPLNVLKETSPAVLVAKRRKLEIRHGYPYLDIVSDRIGGHILAEQAA